jgi:Tfp pilus assembly protein PilO
MGLADILMRLSTREKAITGLTILVVLAVVPYLLVYSPAQEKISSKRRQLDTLQKEITSLTVSLKDRVGEGQAADMPAITLPEANDLAKMIEVISKEADNRGVDFISFTQEGFSYGDQYVQMRLKLELRARYKPFYSFVRALSDKHRLFMIQSVRYETNEAIYPSGVAIIKAVAYLKRQ